MNNNGWVADLIPVFHTAIKNWNEQNTPEKVTQDVFDTLNADKDKILAQLLGFSNRWGKWELDHCNGRAGNSAAGDFLREVQQQAVNEWLSTVAMPTLSSTQLNQIKSSCAAEYKDTFTKTIKRAVVARAEADAKDLVKQLSDSMSAENYIQLMTLIAPKE